MLMRTLGDSEQHWNAFVMISYLSIKQRWRRTLELSYILRWDFKKRGLGRHTYRCLDVWTPLASQYALVNGVCDRIKCLLVYVMEYKFQGRERADVIREEAVANDVELGQYFNRVENLVWIKGNSYYREALADCKERKKSLGEKLERREKRSEELTNQIYNLVGFFSVFQGVILTAVTQLTQSAQSTQPAPSCPPRPPLCGKVWFPVVLSGLAAIAAVVGIWLKYRHLNDIDKLIHAEQLEQREAEKREADLQGKGQRFLFKNLGDAKSRPQKSYWTLKAAAVIGAVVTFTVIFILSYFVILCDKLVIKSW